jgi:hypothetical protein
MPCNLTQGFTLGCKEYAGGIKEVKIKALPINPADFTISAGNQVTIASGSETGWYRYQFRQETASFTETTNVNEQNATLFFQDELKFKLENLSAANSQELQTLAKNNVLVAIKTNAGKCLLMGLFYGAYMTTTQATTGTAFGDFYGYEVTLQYKDTHPIYEISESQYNSLTQS